MILIYREAHAVKEGLKHKEPLYLVHFKKILFSKFFKFFLNSQNLKKPTSANCVVKILTNFLKARLVFIKMLFTCNWSFDEIELMNFLKK